MYNRLTWPCVPFSHMQPHSAWLYDICTHFIYMCQYVQLTDKKEHAVYHKPPTKPDCLADYTLLGWLAICTHIQLICAFCACTHGKYSTHGVMYLYRLQDLRKHHSKVNTHVLESLRCHYQYVNMSNCCYTSDTWIVIDCNHIRHVHVFMCILFTWVYITTKYMYIQLNMYKYCVKK